MTGIGRSSAVLSLVVAGAAIVAVVAGALLAPLLAGAALVGVAIAFTTVRWPLATAIGFLVGGPLYLSEFQVGPLTLDNVAVLYGTGVALVWLLARRARLHPLMAWPASVTAAVVVAAAANGGAGAEGIIRFASLAVLVLLLVNAAPSARRRVATWTEAAVTLGALVLVVQPLTNYPDPYETWGEGVGLRYGGLFGHPNFAAYSVSLVLLYQLYTRRFTAWRGTSAVLLLLALVLTGSRAALLAFALLVLPAMWTRARRFFALLLPGVLALPFVGTTIITRFQNLGETGGLSGKNASGWRFGQWQDALAATRGHEWLGIGWSQTRNVLTDNLGAHSTYIQILLELGRVGAALTAVGLILLLRASRGYHVAWILIGYAAVSGVSDPVLLYPVCLTVLLILVSSLILPEVDEGAVPPAGPAPFRPPTERRSPVLVGVGPTIARPGDPGRISLMPAPDAETDRR